MKCNNLKLHVDTHLVNPKAVIKQDMKIKITSQKEEYSEVYEFKNNLQEKWNNINSNISRWNKKKISLNPKINSQNNTINWTWPYSPSPLSLHNI